MLSKIIDGLSSKLADQWVTTLLTPAFVFWGGGLLAWVWAFGWSSLEKSFLVLSGTVQVVVLIVAFLLVTVSALVIQRFNLAILQLLEGYWPRWLYGLRKKLIEWQEERWKQSLEDLQNLAAKGLSALSAEELAEYARLDQSIMHMPSSSLVFMPTRLGNILRAAELRPKEKYGLESVVCWPRLWLVLPDSTRKEVTDARTALNTTVSLLAWSILFLVWLIWAWWALPVSILVALYAYRWMLSTAETYGDLLEACFDLYRKELYQSLRWPLPGNPSDERQSGAQVTMYLWRGSRQTTPSFVEAKDIKEH